MTPKYKPVKQKHLHDPESDTWGDCYRACVASLLDLDIESVPHVCDQGANEGPGECVAAMNRWLLSEYNLSMFATAYDCDPDVLLNHMGEYFPKMFYLLMGKSKNGTNHIVICKGENIVHDPAIDESGIIGRADDGYTWIELLCQQPIEEDGDANFSSYRLINPKDMPEQRLHVYGDERKKRMPLRFTCTQEGKEATVEKDNDRLREENAQLKERLARYEGANVAYAVKMDEGRGYWVGIWSQQEIAEDICSRQPKGHKNVVIPVYYSLSGNLANKKMEALHFYSNKMNHKRGEFPPLSEVEIDQGQRAREALDEHQ